MLWVLTAQSHVIITTRHRMNALFTKFPCGLLKMAPVPISRLATTGPNLCLDFVSSRMLDERPQGDSSLNRLLTWAHAFEILSCYGVGSIVWMYPALLKGCFLFFLMVTDETAGVGLLRTCHLYRKAPDWAWQLVTVAGAPTSAPDPFFLLYSTGFRGVHCGTSHMLLLPWLRCLCETSVSFGI